MNEADSLGRALQLFDAARKWKSYWSGQIRPFITGDVLEVGSGIGSNTRILDSVSRRGRWVCLEPDRELSALIAAKLGSMGVRDSYELVCGTLDCLATRKFDTILYIDVLEHIEHDRAELQLAAACLRPGGRLIVLSPAHQCLSSRFDRAMGHFRRYNSSTLQDLTPSGLHLRRLRYLDCVGLAASIANVFFLRQSMPTARQLRFWDGGMIPVSRVLDRMLCYSAGKSVLALWHKLPDRPIL
jgi:SAM-dependent methyltransferase